MGFNRKCNQFYTQAFPSPSAAPAHQKISDQMYSMSFSPCLGFPSLRPARLPYIGTVDFLVPARISFAARPAAHAPRPISFSPSPDFLFDPGFPTCTSIPLLQVCTYSGLIRLFFLLPRIFYPYAERRVPAIVRRQLRYHVIHMVRYSGENM